jgi:predicted RecA/RadA family phage recombinase
MQNYKQPGDILTFTAPTGGVVSGTAYLIGALLVVAQASADAGAEFEGLVEGVLTLPKPGSQAWAEGQKIYWNDAAVGAGGQVCTSDATLGQLVGVATAAVGSGAGETTGTVRLNACAPATLEGPQTVIAALLMGTDVTAATANGTLADSAAVNPTKANFDENCKEFAVKINEIIAALKAAGIVASS